MSVPHVLIRIKQIESDKQERDLRLQGSDFIYFGRDPKCGVVLDCPSVSRRHASIEIVGEQLRVSDSSANGTRIGTDGADELHHESRLVGPEVTLTLGPYEVTVARGDEPKPACGSRSATPGLDAPERRKLRRLLLERVDPRSFELRGPSGDELRSEVRAALSELVAAHCAHVPTAGHARLVDELCNEVLGLGPLEPLLDDPGVSEIMVTDPRTIFVERDGRVERTDLTFTDDEAVRAVIERIVTPLGRRIDESSPIQDARLSDGPRVNAVIPPLAIRGPCITIRKFAKEAITFERLLELGALDSRMLKFLRRVVRARKNLVISGGTGSGKTTLLNLLSGLIPKQERIVTVEDAAELSLAQPHVVSLESRPANMEGKGACTIRDLVRNALRMRPDRIIVGECRGGEALDMLQAMNTGHEGSMTTVHANSPHEAVARLETLCLMSGVDLPARAIRLQLAASLHVIVQQARFADGSRRITSISEVVASEHEGLEVRELLGFRRSAAQDDQRVRGEFSASGYLPTFASELFNQGLVSDGELL